MNKTNLFILFLMIILVVTVALSLQNDSESVDLTFTNGTFVEPNEIEVDKPINETFFDTNGVSRSIEVKHGDYVDFMTSGTWTGCLIFEYSTDEITWIMEKYPIFLSCNNRNYQYSDSANESNYGEGMALGFYRWNMIAMLSGRCNYSWNKRIGSMITAEPNEVKK